MVSRAQLVFALALSLGCTCAWCDGDDSGRDPANVGWTMVFKSMCEKSFPGFKAKSAEGFKAWSRKHAKVLSQPEFSRQSARGELPSRPPSPEEKKELEPMCEQVLESFNSALGSPDANFSTPSASWAHFIGSLRTGDRKSAMSCLDPEWRGRIEEEFKAMSETQLREFANSLTDFRLTAVSMQDYQQATVKRPDGKIGFVMFVRSEAGWKIDSF